jgi:hypothetical protein
MANTVTLPEGEFRIASPVDIFTLTGETAVVRDVLRMLSPMKPLGLASSVTAIAGATIRREPHTLGRDFGPQV